MLDRLKSLPLTILLTILIWMYAEAQFTTTQPDVPISIRIASGSPDFAVRTMDPVDKRYTNIINLQVTLQGPKNQIDQIFQDAQSARETGTTEKLSTLTFIPSNEDLRTAAAASGRLQPNLLALLNSMEYFRSRGVKVTSTSLGSISIDVSKVMRLHKTATFQSAIAVDSWTLDPADLEVQIPADALTSIGDSRLVIRAIPDEQQLAALPPETEKSIPVRYIVDYPGPRDDRIRVIPGSGTAKIKTQRSVQGSITFSDVPVWVAGPPAMLARYDVDVVPKTISLTLAGSVPLIDAIRAKYNAAGGTGNPTGAQAAGIFVYLDLSPEDKPDLTAMARRPLRYIIPQGVTLLRSQPDAGFRLSEKSPPATQASALKP